MHKAANYGRANLYSKVKNLQIISIHTAKHDQYIMLNNTM